LLKKWNCTYLFKYNANQTFVLSEILKFEVAPEITIVGAYSASISLAKAMQELKNKNNTWDHYFLAAEIQLRKVL
jgi:hypothetical protein